MTDNIFETLFDALAPIMDILLDVIPPPFNLIVGFIYGGIRELLVEVLFG